MTAIAVPSDKPRRSRWGTLSVLVWIGVMAAIMFGWLPNPFGRFIEAGPATYRNFGDVLVASKSPRLQSALEAALAEDGKLTEADLQVLWPIYEQALPVGFTFASSSPRDVAAERSRLVELVRAAQPRGAYAR